MDAELDEALASAASAPLSARSAAVATADALDSSLGFICSSLACACDENARLSANACATSDSPAAGQTPLL